MRILLIDDNPDDRALALRALERDFPDFQAEEVRDPGELAWALEAGGFAAVVTDYQLHWSDGITVLRSVKERYPDCPVIMFTSSGTEEVAVEAMKSGLDDYVVKSLRSYVRLPFALRTALRRAAERREIDQERARLLAAEREARAAAEAAGMMKDEFLATLSHELRTPLNAIVGWVRLLRSGSLDPEKTVRALETIERNANSQARLIEDLLDVSAIISGKMGLELRPIRLAPVLEAALDAVRPAAESKSVRLERSFGPEADLVQGDPDRLQQVVWNLLANAVKFTPEGGVVRTTLEQWGGRVRIVVSDTGRGIDPAFLPFVFEPFRQADGSLTRSHGGLGLGLAIVRRLVELHGGTVSADSPGPGGGATFIVEIPLRPEIEERREKNRWESGEPGGLECPPQLHGLRILVVDDEGDARELLATLLRDCSAEVEACASVREALAAFERFRPEVLISDLAMPEEDGYDLIRQVRALPPDAGGRTPAVALSAYARAEDRRRALLAGFNIHVAKPVDPAELLVVVASLAGRV
ncbi:MAG: response regulator [Thermoanaerobaculia bacterium]